mgnify:CR=1 FL=1
MTVDLNALEKALAKMTPGHLYILRHDEDDGKFDYHILGSGDVIAVFSERDSPRAKRDAEGFVKLMDAAPAMLARIRELEAAVVPVNARECIELWEMTAVHVAEQRELVARAKLDEASARIRELEKALENAAKVLQANTDKSFRRERAEACWKLLEKGCDGEGGGE